jgi:hypothetical protein
MFHIILNKELDCVHKYKITLRSYINLKLQIVKIYFLYCGQGLFI